MGGLTQKGPLCPESVSYQKKYGRVGPRPWYDTDFSQKKKKIIKIYFFLNLKSQCYTKIRAGVATRACPFGMTTTQGIRDLFA